MAEDERFVTLSVDAFRLISNVVTGAMALLDPASTVSTPFRVQYLEAAIKQLEKHLAAANAARDEAKKSNAPLEDYFENEAIKSWRRATHPILSRCRELGVQLHKAHGKILLCCDCAEWRDDPRMLEQYQQLQHDVESHTDELLRLL